VIAPRCAPETASNIEAIVYQNQTARIVFLRYV
jgi:hypothetical protein